ncbi:squalene-hopene cyclase [Paenibacillus sp. FSL R7-0273]|uniref:DinB family protein n=1 Tax=Paenibacillus sp. FSL R7-0273 TaxID=1536772 RepID=UPI0004F7C3EC|nr:DinB family protein [Paenibacillus sp. FSL R7-0273]AIQ48310.1 squalene-hopene cyclase [Paenibacillus sp. FSL R7-0273]OMF86962.1 squalene--hopene cyclase [Paenibacillus sp. FSL R7-0273]
MNQRPEQGEYTEAQAGYIALVPPEGDILTILREQSKEVFALLGGLSEEQGNFRYAPEKWSIKEMVGHLTDNDRIMSYRLLCFARGEQAQLPGYEEKDYVASGGFDRFTLKQLVLHYRIVRESTLALLESLPEDVWTRAGNFYSVPVTVRAQACMIAGHERHHMNILQERYLNQA